jgi:glycosyltransferase involved in cell wall biosynthesis
MARRKKLLYIQYTNPAAYPPLEHGALILLQQGWEVLFLGTGAYGANELRFPPELERCTRRIPFCPPGFVQKLHFAYYCLWALMWALRWRPTAAYASDMLACPAGLLLRTLLNVPVFYHEHDSPAEEGAQGGRGVVRYQYRARRRLAQKAELCILPNQERADSFAQATGAERVVVVWNCPLRTEVTAPRHPVNGDLWLLYHGSIVPERLPEWIIDVLKALPDKVKLRIVGYETSGSRGYVGELRRRAVNERIGHRLDIRGTIPERRELLDICVGCDAGLALLPVDGSDGNLWTMVGASNKAFDYLACGLAVVVPRQSAWEELICQPGYGLSCDTSDPDSLVSALRWYVEQPDLMREMGERGRQKVLDKWNYETEYEPVLQELGALP